MDLTTGRLGIQAILIKEYAAYVNNRSKLYTTNWSHEVRISLHALTIDKDESPLNLKC